MRKPVELLSLVMAIGVLASWSGAAMAQTDLGNTSWSSPSDTGCGIDISFHSDGSATVSETHLTVTHRDAAHWTLEGSVLHLAYDNWVGGIDGALWQSGNFSGQNVDTIKAIETYQDADSGAERTRSCTFSKDN